MNMWLHTKYLGIAFILKLCLQHRTSSSNGPDMQESLCISFPQFACMCPCDTRGLSTSPTKHFPKLGKQTVNCSTLSMSRCCHHRPSSFDELLRLGISWHLVALDKEARIHLRSCKKPRYFLQSVFDLIPGIGFFFSIFSFPRKKYPNIWGSVPFLLFQRRSCQNHYGHCLIITSLPLQSWVSSFARPVLRGCHEQIWQLRPQRWRKTIKWSLMTRFGDWLFMSGVKMSQISFIYVPGMYKVDIEFASVREV